MQRQIPGGAFVNESDAAQRQIPGAQYLNEQAEAAAVLFTQEGFRWRYDDGDEDGATFSAAQDEPSAASIGVTKRLRAIVNLNGNPGSPSAEQFRLEYRKVGDPDWKRVT